MVIGFPKMQGAIIPLLKGLQSKQTRQKRRAVGRSQDLEVKWLAGEHRAGQSWKGDNVLFSRLAGFPEAMAKMTSLLLGLSESPFSFTFFPSPCLLPVLHGGHFTRSEGSQPWPAGQVGRCSHPLGSNKCLPPPTKCGALCPSYRWESTRDLLWPHPKHETLATMTEVPVCTINFQLPYPLWLTILQFLEKTKQSYRITRTLGEYRAVTHY